MPEIDINPLLAARNPHSNQDNFVPSFQQGGTPVPRSYLHSAGGVLLKNAVHGAIVGAGIGVALGAKSKWVTAFVTSHLVQSAMDSTMAPEDAMTFMGKFSKNTIGMAVGLPVGYIATENACVVP
jgi:hypothetical protein